jgi:hypothetical protein
MTRSFRPYLALTLLIALGGCSGGGDLPSVPPPPKEGTVKEGPSGPGVVPADLKAKIGGRQKKVAAPTEN